MALHTFFSRLLMPVYGALLVLLLVSAGAVASQTRLSGEQDHFWSSLQALCGQAFGGTLSDYDAEADSGWLGQSMTIHFRECTDNEIKVPLTVGENRSRTWVITRSATGLILKHDHRHEDGSEDAVTWYGGRTTDAGRHWRQSFAVDDYSRALFYAEGLDVSASNIWYMEVHADKTFAYGLTRPNRHFRAEFDLTQAVEPPPAPWGE
ncbi:MAG TPA: hypothetical protein VIC53_08740 [Wenzhouxiangella sp.]